MTGSSGKLPEADLPGVIAPARSPARTGNSETIGVLRRDASSGTAASILRSPQLVRSLLCYTKYLTLTRNTGSIVSMTRFWPSGLSSVSCESLPGEAHDSDPMKPQLESLELEDTTELTGVGLTPVVVAHVLTFTTRHRFELIDLTQRVEELVGKTGIGAGVALLQSLHSTAALFVNEWQEALQEDYRTLLEQAVPAEAPWRHNDPRYSDCDRSNAASHLRALLLGSSAMLAVRRGRLVRGTWQSIILAELDGPRTRSVSLQILGA